MLFRFSPHFIHNLREVVIVVLLITTGIFLRDAGRLATEALKYFGVENPTEVLEHCHDPTGLEMLLPRGFEAWLKSWSYPAVEMVNFDCAGQLLNVEVQCVA